MSYKKYCVTLYPGSRPGGAPRFGSAAEQAHYESVIATFKDYKDFKDLPMVGSFSTSLTEEEAVALRLEPMIRAVDLYLPSKPSKITQTDVGWGLAVLANRQSEDKYTYTYTGKGVDIYIIDSGVMCDLEEFEGRATRVFDSDDTEPVMCEHGTETAAVAASKTYGVAKKVNILDVKVHAGDCYIWGLDGLNAVLDHHTTNRAICNMSFGGATPTAGEEDAVNALIAEGVICIAAAGNEATDVLNYPSEYCISIAASDADNTAAYFTNFGAGVDLFAPGELVRTMDTKGASLNVNGTSFSCPYTCGIAAMVLESMPIAPTHAEMLAILLEWSIPDGVDHILANTVHNLVQSQIPLVYLGALGGASTDVIPDLDFRNNYSLELSYLEDDDSIVDIADSTFNSERYADAAITLSVSGPFNKILGSLSYEALKIAASDNPVSNGGGGSSGGGGGGGGGEITPVVPGASILLYTTPTAEELITLTMSLTPSGGSAAFSTTVDNNHETKELIDLQGLDCVIERIGPTYGPGKSYGADCIVSPALTKDYVSINHAYAQDGVLVSVKRMISEVAYQAGISVSILVSDVKVTEFLQSGKFLDVLTSLANLVFGEVLLQNGTWYIGRKTSILGDFTINNNELKSYEAIKHGDVASTILGLIDRLIQALVIRDTLEEELEEQTEELEKLEAIKDLEDDINEDASAEDVGTVKKQFLGNIQIEFGKRNGPWQMIDSIYRVEARNWTYWTPEPGDSVDPEFPTKRYYCVQEIMDEEEGTPTGEMRGLERLGLASIYAEIQEPSNFGGLYHCRGKSVNFSPSFSENSWTSPRVIKESKINPETLLIEEKVFLSFNPMPGSFDPDADKAEDDNLHYLLDVEIRYTPSLVIPWKFAGTLDFQSWPVYSAGLCIGSINRAGEFTDPAGARITTIDDLAEMPGGGTISENQVCIFNSNGELCGIFMRPGYAKGINGAHAGVWDEETGNINSTAAAWGALLGYLPGGTLPPTFHFPGLGDTAAMAESRNIYFITEMPGGHGIDFTGYDPENPDDWTPTLDPANEIRATEISELKIAMLEKENELLTGILEIAFLQEELTSYGAESLIPLIHNAASAKVALNKEIKRQQDLGIKNIEITKRKQAQVGSAMAAIYSALSGLRLNSLKVSCSFIYNNVLPLPQNFLSIQGNITEDNLIVTSVNLAIGSKTVTVEAIRRIA